MTDVADVIELRAHANASARGSGSLFAEEGVVQDAYALFIHAREPLEQEEDGEEEEVPSLGVSRSCGPPHQSRRDISDSFADHKGDFITFLGEPSVCADRDAKVASTLIASLDSRLSSRPGRRTDHLSSAMPSVLPSTDDMSSVRPSIVESSSMRPSVVESSSMRRSIDTPFTRPSTAHNIESSVKTSEKNRTPPISVALHVPVHLKYNITANESVEHDRLSPGTSNENKLSLREKKSSLYEEGLSLQEERNAPVYLDRVHSSSQTVSSRSLGRQSEPLKRSCVAQNSEHTIKSPRTPIADRISIAKIVSTSLASSTSETFVSPLVSLASRTSPSSPPISLMPSDVSLSPLPGSSLAPIHVSPPLASSHATLSTSLNVLPLPAHGFPSPVHVLPSPPHISLLPSPLPLPSHISLHSKMQLASQRHLNVEYLTTQPLISHNRLPTERLPRLLETWHPERTGLLCVVDGVVDGVPSEAFARVVDEMPDAVPPTLSVLEYPQTSLPHPRFKRVQETSSRSQISRTQIPNLIVPMPRLFF